MCPDRKQPVGSELKWCVEAALYPKVSVVRAESSAGLEQWGLRGRCGAAVPLPRLLGLTRRCWRCRCSWQTAAQLGLRLDVGVRAGGWNLHTSTPSAVELWPEGTDWKTEEFRNRALGVLRKGVGSKGVCRWNVLKNLLMIRLFSWFNSLQFCFFLSLSSWSFSLLEFIKSPLLLAAF